MNIRVFDQIRDSLILKRESLSQWLNNTPPAKLKVPLGQHSLEEVHQRLEALDEAVDKAAAGALGVCEVCEDYVETRMMEMDYTCCICLDHYTDDERRTLEFELEMAQTVQRSLLPQEPPDFPNTEIAAFSRPAQIIGGDYFDFFNFKDGSYGLAIADIAGHGISASMHLSTVQTLLRAFVPESASPAEVTERLHRLLVHNTRFNTFVTLFLAAYRPQTRQLEYCNAGHNPPLLLRANGREQTSPEAIELIHPTAAAIGLVEVGQFNTQSASLEAGDLLLIYTDGVTEAANPHGEEFGTQRLAQVAWRARSLPAAHLLRSIRQELESFTQGAPLPDDTTLVIFRVTA